MSIDLEPGTIHGPRIPLRFGSAPTVIHVERREWRTMLHVPGEWVAVNDFSRVDNLIGKRVRLTREGCGGVVKASTEEDVLFDVLLANGILWACGSAKEVEVIDDSHVTDPFKRHRNPFEVALDRHHLLESLGPKARQVWEKARRLRLEIKHDLLMMSDGPARASLLQEFGWTPDDLLETCTYQHERTQ
ncbi:hypothetical protein KIKIMORA_01600 [Brevundimonas phage vB_BpoS-Kikimora]|uniref:Uncharacterized protein n=1 Tax=Brevundimonas phage vB_BpoS-Kikimora TaxID=2948601 RepID=A0A9E7MTD9_9CAUD|nr:hypothetical protein KIKIMORA_01600 [Brevundimonas phage vB_BpoS-Kikimora]